MVRVHIRPYVEADAQDTLDVFFAAIEVTAARDYDPAQIQAWAARDERDLSGWNERRLALGTFVATVDGLVAGFSDVDAAGYIDMLFVAPDFSRRGVARALVDHARFRALDLGVRELSTHASITARPFFEAQGFVVQAERHFILRGVPMSNFLMTAPL